MKEILSYLNFGLPGMFEGSVGIFFEINRLKQEIQAVQSSFTGT